jgi:hypothetical protein
VVDVVIPYAGDCPHRAAALDWAAGQHQWPATITRIGGGAWRKAAAVNPGIARSTAEVIVVADADVACDGIPDAVAHVLEHGGWAIPHEYVHRLDPDATRQVLAGQPWRGLAGSERPYRGIEGGGIVVARRRDLLAVPLDGRFVGWGQEDECWAIALQTMLGPAWRGTHDLVHLWHPPQPRASRRRGSLESWTLRSRYMAARDDPARMRALLDEHDHQAAEHPVHDLPAVV